MAEPALGYSSDIAAARAAQQISTADRIGRIAAWYRKVSPYRIIWFDLFQSKRSWSLRSYYLGMDVEIFSQWEAQSRRVCDDRRRSGELNYWDYVNGNFVADLLEAAELYEAGQSSDIPRIQHMIDYLRTGTEWNDGNGRFSFFKKWSRSWLEQFHSHFSQMSRLFWKAHNTSIVYWDREARRNGIYGREDGIEQIFIDGVIIRVDFTSALPFHFPIFGRMIVPVGIIGEFLNKGPFRYPAAYPCPMPTETFDYGAHMDASLLKQYIHFFRNGRFNSVFTWWFPTPSDDRLEQLLYDKQIHIDAPHEDWARELVLPAQKTIEQIHKKYLEEAGR